jgi:formylglycine-generating enzyme required for sulfatase activity
MLLLILLGVRSLPLGAAAIPDEGLVEEEPKQGRFVKTDSGFMVPYTASIPGSDVTFTMLPIPGGQFTIGSPESEPDREDGEGPQVLIEVAPFWMSAHEITWAEFKQYMALNDVFRAFDSQGIRRVTADRQIDAITAPSRLYDPDSTFQSGDDPRQPAVMMTQYAAKQYTKWLSGLTGEFYRLPAEAEWEYACRAGTKGSYHFGDSALKLEEYAWYEVNSGDRSHKVGQKKPNPWGLFDMHGNVAEWVLDEYSKDGYEFLKSEQRAGRDAIKWPTKAFPRVVRGGSFEMESEKCRSTSRLGSDDDEWKMEDPNLPASPWWFTTTPATGVGFRIVRPLRVPTAPPSREKFWNADVAEISDDVQYRIREQESGAIGIVDKTLPEAIKKLERK